MKGEEHTGKECLGSLLCRAAYISVVRINGEEGSGSLCVWNDNLIVNLLCWSAVSREDGCRGLLCAHLDVAEELYEPPVAVGAHEACLTLEAGSLSL